MMSPEEKASILTAIREVVLSDIKEGMAALERDDLEEAATCLGNAASNLESCADDVEARNV